MMDYELEYLNWKSRQLTLRSKYADTPPGLTTEQADREMKLHRDEVEEHERRRRWNLTTGMQIPEEPFVGRRRELEKLRSLFECGDRTVFLSGMGGIGKSALARAYGRIYADRYDQVLLWSCDKNLEQILTDDGQLGITNMAYSQNQYRSRRKYAREKYKRLLAIADEQRLLIILDNLNNINDPWLDTLLKVPCDMLVTTRLRGEALSGFAILPVESLSDPEEWREFYRLYAGRAPQGSGWKEFESFRDSVLGHTLKMKLALSNPERQWTAERLSRSILRNFRLKKGEKQLLCELSFLGLQGIPEEVCLSCSQECRESLEHLKSYFLVQERVDPSGRGFISLHPVIAEAVRAAWHPTLSRCLAFMEAFALYARFSWYRQREEDLWLAPQVFAVLKRLPEPTAPQFYLYECLATFLWEWEYFSEAGQLERKLYERVRKYYGEDHQFTAQMALRMAAFYHNRMLYRESLPWYELAYRLYKRAKPADHQFYLDQMESCEKLARAYAHLGRYEEAHRLVDEGFIAMEQFKLDAEEAAPELWLLRRPRWALLYHRRATIYFMQGDLDAAQRELDKGQNLFPSSEFQLLEARRQVQASIYLARGEYEKARDAAARDLEICVRYQGESVILSLNYREMLGDALLTLGDMRAAEAEYFKVLSGLREKFPHQTERIERLRRKMGQTS